MSHVRKEDGGENDCLNMTSSDWLGTWLGLSYISV